MAEPLVVYAVDERWRFLGSANWELIKKKHAGQNTKYAVVRVKGNDDMLVVVWKIKLAVYEAGGGLGSIRLLRLCSHGCAGNLFFGTGMHIYDIPKWAPPWAKLRDYMRRDGRGVELFACGVASETAIVTWDHVDGRAEFRPGTLPKRFIAPARRGSYYNAKQPATRADGTVVQQRRHGRMGYSPKGREYREDHPEASSIDLLVGLSRALGVAVRAPIHAQPSTPFTELHGTAVLVHVMGSNVRYRVGNRPPDRASISGPMATRH